MTPDVQRHYENLLAEHYTWMFGSDVTAKVAEQQELLASILQDRSRGGALDLGCGSGFQTLALAELGFRPVIAVDTSTKLLAELAQQVRGRAIETRCADIASPAAFQGVVSADVVVCMGDTLTHLSHADQVRDLLKMSVNSLSKGGELILTFRDLSQPVVGTDRFIPVRADDDRIMTCVLDYEAEHVAVTDLVHTRDALGWTLAKSSYRKLRLSPSDVGNWMEAVGFRVTRNEALSRMRLIVGRKEH